MSRLAIANSGSSTSRASMLRWNMVPASGRKGHSHAKPSSPKSKLRVCNIGTGRTAASRFFVRKSKNILGQKKPSRAAAIWYAEAVRTMRRAQWFLMSFPMLISSRWSYLMDVEVNGQMVLGRWSNGILLCTFGSSGVWRCDNHDHDLNSPRLRSLAIIATFSGACVRSCEYMRCWTLCSDIYSSVPLPVLTMLV